MGKWRAEPYGAEARLYEGEKWVGSIYRDGGGYEVAREIVDAHNAKEPPAPAHSPLPWREAAGNTEGCEYIYDAQGYHLYLYSGDPVSTANRRLILRAVNHHDELVALVRRLAGGEVPAFDADLLLRRIEGTQG